MGDGNILLLQGWTTFPVGRGARYEVQVGSDIHSFPFRPDVRLEVDGAQSHGRVAQGFWLPVPVGRERIGRSERLRAALVSSHGRFAIVERDIRFVRRPPVRAEPPITTPLVVCLATYDPDLALFRRQIDSLVAQTFRDFTCLVQDDGSRPEAYAEIQRICGQDPRFRVARNEHNRGFYRNFERCLDRVPPAAEYVALCDQDDVWYPEKLETCVARLRGNVKLVYSDMRVVDGEGRVLAPTYWTTRRNNYRSLATMLFANTVSGAAAVMRNEVVQRALPFPRAVGHAFHDHWLAYVAMLAGELDYVDRPLYDYTQHPRNVTGHRTVETLPLGEALATTARRVVGVVREPERIRAQVLWRLSTYRNDYRRLALFRHILRLRFSDVAPDKTRALDLFADRWWDAPALLLAHLGVRSRGDTTDMAEVRLGLSLAVHRMLMPLLPPLMRARRAWAQLRR